VLREPQIAVDPHRAELPQIALAPSTNAEVPQIADEPQSAVLPQTAEEFHTELLPQSAEYAEISDGSAMIACTTLTLPVTESNLAMGDKAGPTSGSVQFSAAQASRYPAPTVKMSFWTVKHRPAAGSHTTV
jgi:hypothetical protein